MTSGVCENRQPLSHKSKRQATSGAEKYPSRVHPPSDKWKPLTEFSSKNIPTALNTERGKEVNGLKKEGKTKTAQVTLADQSNNWIGMREDTVMKQQQWGLAVTNSDSVKPAKTFIPDKYKNLMKLKKLKRIKYFTKSLLELRVWGFS